MIPDLTRALSRYAAGETVTHEVASSEQAETEAAITAVLGRPSRTYGGGRLVRWGALGATFQLVTR